MINMLKISHTGKLKKNNLSIIPKWHANDKLKYKTKYVAKVLQHVPG
jgi:hypothetical protein